MNKGKKKIMLYDYFIMAVFWNSNSIMHYAISKYLVEPSKYCKYKYACILIIVFQIVRKHLHF